jgi:hypothetical protein
VGILGDIGNDADLVIEAGLMGGSPGGGHGYCCARERGAGRTIL